MKAQAITGGNFFIDGIGLFGELVDFEPPKFEMNKEANMSIEMSCLVVKYEVDKKTTLSYDVENKIYSVNGEDLYEPIRKNIS